MSEWWRGFFCCCNILVAGFLFGLVYYGYWQGLLMGAGSVLVAVFYALPRKYVRISVCKSLLIVALLPSSSHALEIGRDTIEQVIDRIALSDCEWSEVIEQVTVVHYREFVPFVVYDQWGGHTPQPREGIFPNPCFVDESRVIDHGAIDRRFPNAQHPLVPEWCTPRKAKWEGWWHGTTGKGQWREWDDRIVLTFARLVDDCHECTVVPEPGTWMLVGMGIVGLVVARRLKRPAKALTMGIDPAAVHGDRSVVSVAVAKGDGIAVRLLTEER